MFATSCASLQIFPTTTYVSGASATQHEQAAIAITFPTLAVLILINRKDDNNKDYDVRGLTKHRQRAPAWILKEGANIDAMTG